MKTYGAATDKTKIYGDIMVKYNLGLVSISFRKNSPDEILCAMQTAGLTHIEWGSDVHCPPDKAKDIAALTKKYNIVCCSYGTYFKIGVTPAEEIYEYINAAKILGTDILRLWCGDKNSGDYSDSEKQTLFAECRRLAEIAEQNGVILCMECHVNTYTNTKESALQLMGAVDSPNFKMYWQPNQFREIRENIEYAKLLSPYTEHIHVFNWKEKEKYPLLEAKDIWKRYLDCFEDDKTLLLEFMPDGKIESLKTEADALREIIK